MMGRVVAQRAIALAAFAALFSTLDAAPAAAHVRFRHHPVTLDTSRFPRQYQVPGGVIESFNKHYVTSSMDSNGDENPYGITVATETTDGISTGTVFVCNFNNSQSLDNIQGLGTSIEEIYPYGSNIQPHRWVEDERITGCNALSIDSGNRIFIAGYDSNLVWGLRAPIDWSTPLEPSTQWTGPWGIAYSKWPNTSTGTNYIYVTGAYDGGLWRYDGSHGTYTEICNNFFDNHGVPGEILAPSGLSYDSVHDILYMVEGYANTLIAIRHPEEISAGGLERTPYGFTGTYGSYATVLSQGGYINAPISTTVLYDGHVLVENTGDDYMLEFGSDGSYYGRWLADTGAPGALFGVVPYGTTQANTRIYYNDDNDNSLYYLSLH
jgi:hypothetical protein